MNAPDRRRRIADGERIDCGTVSLYRDGRWQQLNCDELFAGRRVIVFGLPGAFTPTCSSHHLPRFNELAPELKARGVEEIVCVSVNDPYVMEAWSRQQEADRVSLLADGNAEFTEAIGMLVDKRDSGFGMRSWRYAMLVDNGVVTKLFCEPEQAGDPYQVSDADTMLRHLDPEAKPPDEVVIFTRAGCPHCARAKELLEQGGFDYVEFALDDSIRGRVVRALADQTSVPQVFINGELIGGADELERSVYGPAGPPESRAT